jgi:hypothetical protein
VHDAPSGVERINCLLKCSRFTLRAQMRDLAIILAFARQDAPIAWSEAKDE